MATYSVYNGLDYQTIGSTLVLQNAATQSYTFTENKVVTDIPDNIDKLVYPTSIRNTVLSLYDSVPFKENLIGSKYFIGIDKTNQNIKKPIYIGKRHYNGTEILNSTILSGNDVIIHNTKPDTSNLQFKTVVGFITGDSSQTDEIPVTITAQQVKYSNGSNRIDLTLNNLSGDVNVLSKGPNIADPGSFVVLNGITYSRLQDSDPTMGGSASDGRVLAYNNGLMTWADLTPSDPGFYGASYTVVPIYGSETYVNGYSLDFTSSDYVPVQVGDIKLGENFKSVSISSMLNRIIYEYLAPSCTIKFVDENMSFAEIGSSPTIQLSYTITKKSLDTMPTALSNMIPNQVDKIDGFSRTVEGVAKGVVIVPMEKKTTVFTITASDGQKSNSASASVSGVYPFFFGFTSSTIVNSNILKNMTKVVDNKSEQKLDIYRSGVESTDTFYFMYDYDYGPLSAAYDPGDSGAPNGYEILAARFNRTDAILSSPDGLWAQKKFMVYYSKPGFVNTYINSNTISSFFRFIFG